MSNAAERPSGIVAWTIDDSEFDRRLNSRILTRNGSFSHIFDFASAREALEELRRTKVFPHVIFLDVMMPIANGFDFLAQATEEFGDGFSSRVVIMLTSTLNPYDRESAEQFPAVHEFLSKPLTANDVASIAQYATDAINRNQL